MSASVTLSATLSSPQQTASAVLSFTRMESIGRLEMTGAGSHTVDLVGMGSAGLKGLLVMIDTLDALGVALTAVVKLTWTSNSTSKTEEISAGGFFALANPAPTTGITALAIVVTAPAVVHLWALG